ncbi:MAG: T9SS type A sorting domain-containing protein [Bacteroidetes bacterium]|nr:T9SS type A sorting domain-containing protein [Bacteroidota bacterium]
MNIFLLKNFKNIYQSDICRINFPSSRTLLPFLLFIYIVLPSFSQVSSTYTFTQGAGSPTLLTPTYTEHTTGTTDYGVYTNIPIGFTFQFACNNNYTAVSISNDGYIVLGTSLSNTYTPLSSGSDNNVIAALAADLQGLAGGSLRSKTAGSAPNRTFTVEWKNYEEYGGTAEDYTFQIVLTETSNTIQFYYSNAAQVANENYEVGLRGASSADFNNRTKIANTSWTGSSAGTANSDKMVSGSSNARCPNGLFTWTPVVCSGTPAGGTAAASPATMCSSESSALTVTGGATGCGLTFQWQSGPTSTGAWTDISGATSASYNASPSATTWYRRVTTCTASGLSGNSSSASVTINPCIIIGTGTSTTSSYPYQGYYHDARSQFIITAAELSAAGICPNSTLTSLSFNVSSKGSTQQYTGFTIKIGNTASSTFASATWLTPAFTTVYNGNWTTATGWNLHTFSTGYVWNGTSNIVVETCFNNTSYTSYDYVYYTTTASGNTVCYAEMDASTGCTLAAESTSDSRPNMKFNYTVGPPCSGTPTGGTVSASPAGICLGESSTLSLSGQTVACGITFQWQSSPNPITVWTNIGGATSTSYIATPTASTNYRCVVTCTASGLSANSASALVTINTCIILGTGTFTVNYPYYGGWEDSRSQFIISASELAAAGLCGGSTLTSLFFNVSSKGSTQQYKNFTIKIGNTASSTFSSATWLTPAFTTVYSANWTTAVGWNQHLFSTSFVWNGTSNLVVETCFDNTSFTSSDPVYYTTTPSGSTVCYNYADGSAGCTMAASSTSSSRPNMKFNYTPNNCSGTPTGGTANASPSTTCGGNAYDLSLSGQTIACGLTYQWQSSPNPISTWTDIPSATSIPYTVSPATPTNYRCVITCTISGFSGNSSSVLVTMTGFTCSNPVNVTLPYTKTGESTECMNNDYNNASPSSCGSSYESGSDKVYKVLIGAAGCVNVSLTNASDASIGFQIYNGCPDVGGSTCVFNSTTGATGGTLTNDINIPSAGYYYLIVDNWAGPSSVNYDISISAPGGNTANDPCSGAIPLTLGVSAPGDNTCTNAFGEPAAPACWTTGTMNTIWYVVTIPGSRDLAIKTTVGSLLKTQIDLYRGNACGSLTYVDCNQDAASCGTAYDHSYLYYQNIGAGTYAYIRVDGEDNLVGTFSILVIDGNNQAAPVLPPIVGQDCGPVTTYTNPVCGATTSVSNPGNFAFGNICDFTGASICLASGEKSSTWYTININANGNLEFDIVPNDYGNPNPLTGQSNPGYVNPGDETDYDFAIWKWESTCDGTGDGVFCCAEIAAGTTAATRCDYDADGVTGLYSATDETAPAAYSPDFDWAYENQIAVTNGEIYVLAISNYMNNYVSGYTLKFSATSPIAYSTPGASLTWSSNTSNDWSLPGNWGGCTDPTCNLNALINSGGAQPVISANASVQNLTISAGATLTINANCTLTVCGNFVNNGTLTMASTATLLFNNASVVQNITGSLTGTNKIGNLTITKTGGSVIINPVVSLDIGGNFTTTNSTSVFNASNQTVKISGNFSTAANTTLTNCPNIEFNGIIPQTFTNSSGTISFTNVIMNNSGGGMTLTGGTTSNLNVTGTLTLTNGIIYTANPPLLIMASASLVSPVGGSVVSFVDGPMQKVCIIASSFIFPVGDAFNRWARIGVSGVTAAATFQAQYFYSVYSNTTTMAGAPAPVLNNVSKMEYWQLDRTAGTGNATVTLYWENAASSGINSCVSPPNTGDLVVARWNGTGWENKNTVGGSYSGSCAGTSAGTVTSDVVTAFSPFSFGSKSPAVNPLPVGLLAFTGEHKNHVNILYWETGSETNNDFFTIERSVNGWEFTELGNIDGSGISNQPHNYQFTDDAPVEGLNYYRLKQTDFDGNFSFASNIVVLKTNNKTGETAFMIFPNPATNSISLVNRSGIGQTTIIEIKDISGRILLNTRSDLSNGSNPVIAEISLTEFPEGIYFLTVFTDDRCPVWNGRFLRVNEK